MEPIIEIDKFINKDCWLNGELHSEDGLSIEWDDGTKKWLLNGKRHRVVRHRVDGPAIEWVDGTKKWFLNGSEYTFKGWKVGVRKYYDTQEDYLLMLLKLD